MKIFYASFVVFYVWSSFGAALAEVDLGDGLSYVSTYLPDDCTHKAEVNDIIHYHYIGRLQETGEVFGRSFDYDSPYIVALGQGRIIAGMDRGLFGTCLWERRKITIPPELGYGDRGVGRVIPPNATLVFYIRMIRIERDGQALGIKPTLEEAWAKALRDYTDEHWQDAVNSIEAALTMYNEYDSQSMLCLNMCKDTVADLTRKEQAVVDAFSDEEPLLKHYLHLTAKAKCIRQCKRKHLPKHLQNPDPEVVAKFKSRVPFSYLQYSFYKLENHEEALKSAYTYFFYNPNDTMIVDAIKFYKKSLKIKSDEYPSREPGMKSHHIKYDLSKKAYGAGKWLEAVDLMEEAVDEDMNALDKCQLSCDDIVYVNFTNPNMSVSEYNLLKQLDYLPNAMDYYDLLKAIAKSYLTCHIDCHHRMATINGEYYQKYLPGHFNHLQYAYYKLGMLHKSAEAASTFRVLEPSDIVMANNVKHYRSKLNVPFESFKARDDVIAMKKLLETEERILNFFETGSPMKRSGRRGDNGDLYIRDEL